MPNNQQHPTEAGAIQNAEAGAPAPAYALPLALERALFIRFWLWLSAVGVIVVAVTAGAWVLIANQFIPEAKEAGRIAAETKIHDLSSTLNNLANRANAEETRITELAGTLTEKVSNLTGITNSATTRADSIEQIYKNSALIAKGFDDVNKIIHKIADNPEFHNAVITNPEFHKAVISPLTTKLSSWGSSPSDPHYYAPPDRNPESIKATSVWTPHPFMCVDGYYMIGLVLFTDSSGFTAAQAACSKLNIPTVP
jgi:hypothetical protein